MFSASWMQNLTKMRREVMECEDVSDLHFSLGVYIRNRLLYGDEKNYVLSLFDEDDSNVIIAPDGTKFRFNIGHPDMQWEPIAEGYKEYLIKSQIQKI